MQIYSQGREQEAIINYLNPKNFKYLTFLDIGANDGKTLSNTHALALLQASGVCVEPSETAFKALQNLYKDNIKVECFNVAISDRNGRTKMWDSGTHLGKGDTSLLSTLNPVDKEKWEATTEFKEVEVELMNVEWLIDVSPYKTFDFISIDAEGEDLIILSQMNLTKLECSIICIEHNSDKLTKDLIKSFCYKHGLRKVLLDNSENIILAK